VRGFDTPYLARYDQGSGVATVRPFTSLKIDNTYLFSRLRTRESNAIFSTITLFGANWNWQLNRETFAAGDSAVQRDADQNRPGDLFGIYPDVSADRQEFQCGFSNHYLVHPVPRCTSATQQFCRTWTRRWQSTRIFGGVRRSDRMINDGRLFFVKASYLFRF